MEKNVKRHKDVKKLPYLKSNVPLNLMGTLILKGLGKSLLAQLNGALDLIVLNP